LACRAVALHTPPPPSSPLFPYTTLFRSQVGDQCRWVRLRPGLDVDRTLETPARPQLFGQMRSERSQEQQGGSACPLPFGRGHRRSEEHTSELQSRGQLVCRLLLEKKKSH